ncbi:MAG: galactokinase [Balneolaceae bacterium]|nr:galactokinase [Balneolaceae bacterium]
MKKRSENILKLFKKHFSGEPVLVRSPGRINLIGEHTDYNDGFVLPAAIDKNILFAMAPNGIDKIRLVSADMDQAYETGIADHYQKADLGWANYILGVVDQVQKKGKPVRGFDCVFGGNIPIGAGLSSSAALEGGVLFGLNELFRLALSPLEIALMAQAAENQFVGVQCGIMDQFASIHGKEGHALKLDCRTLDFSLFPVKTDIVDILLCDTKVHRELATSEYNVRRSQCEEGVKALQKHEPGIQKLRDVSHKLLESHKHEIAEIVYRRCRFVVNENQRVLDACDDLESGNINSFGRRMYESHYGLRDEYEVSCRELDLLVEITENLDPVLGARMMGGGFGGCTINLVKKGNMKEVKETIAGIYSTNLNSDVEFYEVNISEGTGLADSGDLI